jgi:hypothetical protein
VEESVARPDTLPGENEIRERYRLDDAAAPPAFPPVWRTPFILNPFGDSSPPLGQSYNQLVVADLTYAADWQGGAGMLVDLYLVENLICASFFFRNTPAGTTQWWWLCRDRPGGPVRNSYGPFPTSLRVPSQAFLQPGGYDARWGGLWKAALRQGNHYVVPTPRDGQEFGSWFMIDSASGSTSIPLRVANIGADNALGLPILGAYFIALSSGKNMLTGEGVADIGPALRPDRTLDAPEGFANPMVTQKDLQAAMANPLCSCACTPADIAALVPGLEATPRWPLPEWTNQVYIDARRSARACSAIPRRSSTMTSLPIRRSPPNLSGSFRASSISARRDKASSASVRTRSSIGPRPTPSSTVGIRPTGMPTARRSYRGSATPAATFRHSPTAA